MKLNFLLGFLFVYGTLLGQVPTDASKQHKPMQSTAVLLGAIPPLRDLASTASSHRVAPPKTWHRRNYFTANELRNPDSQPRTGDPLVNNRPVTNADNPGPELIPLTNFEGIYDDSGVTPPDPTGDIGKNHYVQMVNASGDAWLQVWDKEGNSVLGPILSSTIWSQVQSGSIGDPIVQYDHAAERWLIMEMQGFGDNQLLVAISDDSDPTGGWKAYRVQCLGFPDYPKLYVWHNAYFITVNEIVNSNECTGYALDRAAMLAGDPVVRNWRFKMPNYGAIQYQPATGVDWEGGPPPPANSPGMILRVYDDAWDGGNDHIELWQVFLNWQDTTQSFLFGPTDFAVAPFETRVCFGGGLFDCLEQPGVNPGAPRITALENIIMYRAPYRNFGTHESFVFNHVSDVSSEVGDGGDAAVRWYEMRRNAGEPEWFVYQQGTYAPDATNRFTGTLSLDEQGNIALGYSVVSTSVFPGLRVTGRRAGDPLGQMTVQEYPMAPGTADHMDVRWGDYSNMSVDPEDGKTFWFTGEYQPNSTDTWGTRIASFLLRRDTYDITPEVLVTPVNSALLGAAEPITVRLTNGGIEPASDFSLRLRVDGQELATEPFVGTIAPSGSAEHTFVPTTSWSDIGQTRLIEVIAEWDEDRFRRNDTLRTPVRKLTSFDGALVGKSGLPGLICTQDFTFGLLLRNASGLPLDSAQIRWRLGNSAPWQITPWTGHLLPGQVDTVPIELVNITGTQNLFKAQVLLPNGQADQDTLNDKIQFKVYSTLAGAFMTAEANTQFGELRYEIKRPNGDLIAQGEFNNLGFGSQPFCVENETCYILTLKSKTFQWNGNFRLLDIFDNPLVEATFASPEIVEYSFCSPARKNVDVGAVTLLAPQTGANLTATETVQIAVRNFGLENQNNVEVAWRPVGSSTWNTEIMAEAVPAGATKSYTFLNSTTDGSTLGQTYDIEMRATLPNDEDTTNDTRTGRFTHRAPRDLKLVRVSADACGAAAQSNLFIEVNNFGLTPITSFSIAADLNGQPSVFEFTGLVIEPGQDYQVLQNIPISAGINNCQFSISDVNGEGPDQFADNNTASLTFETYPNGSRAFINFQADDSPTQTRWEILNSTNEVIYSGGPYEQPFQFVGESICLRTDSCYNIKIYDSGNNGFDGFMQIFESNTGRIFFEYIGGQEPFTNLLSQNFCAESACTGFDFNYTVYPPTGGLSNGKILVQANSGTAPFLYRLNGGPWGPNFLFTGLSVGTYLVECVDAFGCLTEKTVLVGLIDTDNPTTHVSLEVFPNPTAHLLWLKMSIPNGQNEAFADVFDPYGKLIRTVRLTRFDQHLRGVCSLETRPAGTYVVRIRDHRNKVYASRVVIKK
jgi:hypothetical protein